MTPDEVEASFERVIRIRDRDDGSYVMEAETPSGREIKVIWRYDRIHDDIPDFMGEFDDPPIFVITAY